MTDWEKYKLKEITCSITDGKHGDCVNQKDSGYYFLSAKDVGERILHYNKARQIIKEDFMETHKRTKLESGDILISNSGTIGKMAIAREDEKTYKTTFQKSVAIIKPDKSKTHTLFLYYYFLKNKQQLINIATGTTQQNLLLGDLRKFPVILPFLPEQRRIAEILSSLDDKIELNLEINKTLEKMAMAIYKEWFVDFGPFRDGEFVDSELGMIPKGWEVMKIRDISKLHYGKALREKDRIRGAVPVYGSSGVVGYHNYSIVDGPSLIIGRKGNVGSVYWENNNSFPIDTVYYINQVPLYSLIHLYFKFLTTDFISRNSDSVVPGLNRKMAEDDSIIIPCKNVYNRFVDIVYPLFELRFSNLNENKKLIETRDYLLPKLISGEIRVKTAEKKMKEVL